MSAYVPTEEDRNGMHMALSSQRYYPERLIADCSPKVGAALTAEGESRPHLLRLLTDEDIQACSALAAPPVFYLREQARRHDPYVWIDPWTGRP